MPPVGFAVLAGHRVKIKRRYGQILESYQKVENVVEHEVDSDKNCSLCTWNSPQGLGKETE